MAGIPKKLLIAAAAVAGLLVLAVVAVLFTDFDSPELGRLALGKVGEASGFDLQAQGFRLNLLRGLELEQVEARATDGSMTASVDKLVLKHRPGDLLGGTLTVTEVLIDSPRVELVDEGEAPEKAPEPAAEEAPAGQEEAAETETEDGQEGDADAQGDASELRGLAGEAPAGHPHRVVENDGEDEQHPRSFQGERERVEHQRVLSGQGNTWTRWFPVSATYTRCPSASVCTATPRGVANRPGSRPGPPTAPKGVPSAAKRCTRFPWKSTTKSRQIR